MHYFISYGHKTQFIFSSFFLVGTTTLVFCILTEKKLLQTNKKAEFKIKQHISCDSSNFDQCHIHRHNDYDSEKACTLQHSSSTSSYVMHAQVFYISFRFS